MAHRGWGSADGRVISGVAVLPADEASPENLLRSLDRYGFEDRRPWSAPSPGRQM